MATSAASPWTIGHCNCDRIELAPDVDKPGILRLMRRYFQRWSGLLWVALLALVIVRAADAHMHLCLEGEVHGSSVHVSDSGRCLRFDGDSQSEHQDQDVDVFGAVLAKKSADADVLDLPIAVHVVLSLLPLERGVVPYVVLKIRRPSCRICSCRCYAALPSRPSSFVISH